MGSKLAVPESVKDTRSNKELTFEGKKLIINIKLMSHIAIHVDFLIKPNIFKKLLA